MWNTVKGKNLRVIGINEGDKSKSITGNIFTKIVKESFHNLKKKFSINGKKHTVHQIEWNRKGIPHDR